MPTNDDVLTWDDTLASNQKWAAATGGSGIPETLLDAKGDLIVASAADTAARLPVGATNGHVLTVDSAETLGVKWAAGGSGNQPTIETSLPGSPADLDEIYLQVGSGDTAVYWHLKYLDAITDAYGWVYLGGAPLSDSHAAAASTASGTYVELDSGQPQVTLPNIGVYDFFHGFTCTRAGASCFGIQNIKTNGSNPGDDADAITNKPIGNDSFVFGSRTVRRTVPSFSTNALAVLVYRTDGNSNAFSSRFLSVTPVRLG